MVSSSHCFTHGNMRLWLHGQALIFVPIWSKSTCSVALSFIKAQVKNTKEDGYLPLVLFSVLFLVAFAATGQYFSAGCLQVWQRPQKMLTRLLMQVLNKYEPTTLLQLCSLDKPLDDRLCLLTLVWSAHTLHPRVGNASETHSLRADESDLVNRLLIVE